MLSEEQLEIIAQALIPLFDYLEREVIADIARRVGKTTMYTRTAELQVMHMEELGYSPSKIRMEVMRILQADANYQNAVTVNTIEYKQKVKQLIADIVAEAKQNGDKIVANAGEMSWIDDMRVWNSNGLYHLNNSYLPILCNAYSKRIFNNIVNLTMSSGFRGVNGWTSIANAYTDQLNKAVQKIATGTFSQNEVIRDTVRDLAHSGLRSIDFASGRSMQIDSAVRVAVRTGTHQLTGEIQKENIKDTGVKYVYIEEHEAARDKGVGIQNHKAWQGKVYAVNLSKATADDLVAMDEECRRIGQASITDCYTATGYSPDDAHSNNPLGLYGYNCRHIMRPWFIGASTLPDRIKQKPDVTIDGKKYSYYDCTQKMRQYEARIRDLKREKEALESLQQDTKEIKAKIKEVTNNYDDFCAKAGTKPSPVKTRVEAGSSDLTKTKAWQAYQNLNNP